MTQPVCSFTACSTRTHSCTTRLALLAHLYKAAVQLADLPMLLLSTYCSAGWRCWCTPTRPTTAATRPTRPSLTRPSRCSPPPTSCSPAWPQARQCRASHPSSSSRVRRQQGALLVLQGQASLGALLAGSLAAFLVLLVLAGRGTTMRTYRLGSMGMQGHGHRGDDTVCESQHVLCR